MRRNNIFYIYSSVEINQLFVPSNLSTTILNLGEFCRWHGWPTALLFRIILILSREKKVRHEYDVFSSSSSTNNMSLFSACRIIPSDPAQAAQEVAFVGRRTSGQQAEGGGRDGGGSGQSGGGGRLAVGRLQDPGGGDRRAGRQSTIAGRGKEFTCSV